jgi:hypothetical protein
MTVKGNVLLNNVGYQAVPFELGGRTATFHRYKIDPFVPGFSEGGPNKLLNLRNVIPLTFPNFTLGFGRRRIDSDSAFDPKEYRRFFDARADTRRAEAVRLPPLEQDSTGELEALRASVHWKGSLWTLWEGAGGSGGSEIKVLEVSSFNFGGGGSLIDDANENTAQDIIHYQDKLVVLYCGTNDHHIEHSTDGATWTAATTDITANLLSNNVTANENTNFGRLEVVGDEAVAIVWHESNNTITFFSSTSVATWTDETLDIPSGAGIQGVAVLPGIDGADKLYVLADSGLWEIDTSPSTWTSRHIKGIPATKKDVGLARRMVSHQGSLWLTTSSNDDIPFDMYRITNGNNMRLIEANVAQDGTLLGLAASDGVPTALLGPVTWMESAGEFLYATLGGAVSGRNGHLICHNGLGWHYIHHNSTAGQRTPWLAVDGETLHFTKRTANNAHTGHYLENIHANPTTGISVPRALSGYIDLPYLDAGFPLDKGIWAQVGINAEALSAANTGEYIHVDFGEDDGSGGLNARDNTDLGDFLSGTTKIDFASGAGVSSVNMGLRVNLHRDSGTNTDTPKLKDVQLLVTKKPSKTQGFVFMIDLERSAGLEEKTTEAVITTLETARDLGTFPNFQYGNMAVTNVDVLDIDWGDEIAAVGDSGDETVPNTNARRQGMVVVRVEEPI